MNLDRRNKSASGVALVIVLAFLVLITTLVIAFFSSVSTELSGTKSYASGVTAKQLADSAAQMVMGSIKQATSGTNPADGTPTAWASQPGMIRAYDNTGNLISCYKLYSSDNMVVNGASAPNLAADVPNNWNIQPALFTDLNSPVTSGASTVFPIIDGNAIKKVSMTSGTMFTYSASGTGPDVAGFWVVPSPQVSYSSGTTLSSTNTPVPMPVKWIYVLRDGRLTVPTGADSTGRVADWSGSTVSPSSSNPIVGRIAFWTDDESCKVNINTASEASTPGSFADTPRVSTTYDLNMANCPPYQNEFQRYPGHPATVSLSTVFSNLQTDPAYPESIYSTSGSSGPAPRTIGGGSKSATVKNVTTNPPSLGLLANRLYATTDEFMFQPGRSQNTTLVDDASLQRAKFFITASSRAPDVNLFGQPRFCMWPISSTNNSQYRTAYDQLIAFCSTVNNKPYYFQRSSNTSQTEWQDIVRNKDLLAALKNLCGKSVPGFNTNGKTFATKYSVQNSAGGTELDQILMEMFDYIRCVNLSDTSGVKQFATYNSNTNLSSGWVVPSYNSQNDTKGFGRFETISKAGLLFIGAGDNTNKQVISVSGSSSPVYVYGPDVPANNVRVQAALVFELFDPSEGYIGLYPGCTLKVTNSTLTWNYGTAGPSQQMFSIPSTGALVTTSPYQTQSWSGALGIHCLMKSYTGFTPSTKFLLTALPTSGTAAPPYPDFDASTPISFGGGDVTVQVLSGATVVQTLTFNFPASSFPVPSVAAMSALTHTNGSGNFYIHFSNITDPGAASAHYGRMNIDQNGLYTSSSYYKYVISSYDTMESVQNTSGDLRLSAGRATVASSDNLFGPHPLYGGKMAHSFTENDGEPYYGATRGQLTPSGTTYYTSYWANIGLTTPFLVNDIKGNSGFFTCEPDGFGTTAVPPAKGVMSGTTTQWSTGKPPGDWDNGVGSTRDGPYINKPDEGAINAGFPPYYSASTGYKKVGTTYFSPARQMPSAVMFGSLPTGVIGNRPWQTLLFHHDSTGLHAGAQSPPDHLLLDLFNMPVVEPYAISEPLSTAGRVNMNYAIAPFTYINRDTGIRAVLRSQQMLAIPNTACGGPYNTTSGSNAYKQQIQNYTPNFASSVYSTLRFGINLDETLKGFQARFNNNDIFRSASEICDLDLIPDDKNDANAKYGSTMQTYWEKHLLTGDNSRERPYANIYPLLTTKSNTFTVHMRVQTLKKVNGTNAATWDESRDQVTSEYRGSQIIERYVDAADATIPDYADSTVTTPIDSFYKFRVVSSKKFTP